MTHYKKCPVWQKNNIWTYFLDEDLNATTWLYLIIISGQEANLFVTALEWINGPRQANLVLIAYASSEGSGEPAHPRSLARTFAGRSYKQWVKRNIQIESQIPGPSEWLGMRS